MASTRKRSTWDRRHNSAVECSRLNTQFRTESSRTGKIWRSCGITRSIMICRWRLKTTESCFRKCHSGRRRTEINFAKLCLRHLQCTLCKLAWVECAPSTLRAAPQESSSTLAMEFHMPCQSTRALLFLTLSKRSTSQAETSLSTSLNF